MNEGEVKENEGLSETFGKRLARTIKAAGTTKEAIAMGAGVTRSMMTAYLKGQEIPPYDEADRIAELVGTTAEWLLHGRHPGQPRL